MRKLIASKLSTLHPLDMMFRGMLLSIGLLFFAFAAWQAIGSLLVIGSYDKYTAEVKRCESDGPSSAKFNFYQCDVRYQTAGGRRSASIDKLLLTYDEGDTVDIYIGRGEQYSVHAGGFLGLWAIPTLLTIIGLGFVGFGFWPTKDKQM